MDMFVTGGTGFIGSHFLNAALSAGHKVIALRRAGRRPRIPLVLEPAWLEKPMDELSAGDLAKIDAVVHLAAVGVSPQEATWDELMYWNVQVGARLARLAADAGVGRVVASGTFAEYGRSAERYEFVPPDAPLEPTSPYAASKAALFVLLHALAVERSLELAYLRVFSVFGEGQHCANFWPSLREAALSGCDFPMTLGQQVRDFVPVEGVAARILSWTTRQAWPGKGLQVRNLASGNPVRLVDFAQHWWRHFQACGRLLPGALPYRPSEVMRFAALVDKEDLSGSPFGPSTKTVGE